MRNRLYAIAAVLMVQSAAAFAGDDFIKGVYLESQKLCADARKDSLDKVIEASNLILTARGFDALEYNCAFVQVSEHPRQPSAWLVTAICEEPDHMSPELFAIIERQAGQLDVTAMTDKDGENGLSGTYHLCEGVKLP